MCCFAFFQPFKKKIMHNWTVISVSSCFFGRCQKLSATWNENVLPFFADRNLIGEVTVLEEMTSHLPVIEIRIEECRGKVFNVCLLMCLFVFSGKIIIHRDKMIWICFLTFCLSRWGDRRQDQRFEDQVIMRKRPWAQCWYFPVGQLGALPPSARSLLWLPVRQGKGHPEVAQSSWFYSKSFEWPECQVLLSQQPSFKAAILTSCRFSWKHFSMLILCNRKFSASQLEPKLAEYFLENILKRAGQENQKISAVSNACFQWNALSVCIIFMYSMYLKQVFQ